MHRLMILGSSFEFTGLVREARARNIYTVVCDGFPRGPAKQEADAVYNIDVQEIHAIAEICKEERIDRIVTSFSDLLLECMVKISDAAGLPCYLKPEQLPFYRDKAVMKRTLLKLGIPTPRFVCLEPDFSDADLAGLSFPVVTKPLDKYGSRGLFVLHSPDELRASFAQVCASSQIKRILAEEYHAGYEFNMMTWVHQGEVFLISIADREKSPIPTNDIPVSSRNVYPSRLIDQVRGEAMEILRTYIRATDQREGALSMQFFWKPGEPIQVCEIAARFFGYEHELVELSGGLSIEKLLLDAVYDPAALKAVLAAHNPCFPKVSAALYFHGREKRIQEQNGLRACMELPGVKKEDSVLFYEDGEKVVWHGSNPYVARFYITGGTREEVDALSSEIFRKASVHTEDGEEILYQNILPSYPED